MEIDLEWIDWLFHIKSSYHHINILSNHHIINHHIITSPHHHIITSSHHHIITSPQYHITTSWHYNAWFWRV